MVTVATRDTQAQRDKTARASGTTVPSWRAAGAGGTAEQRNARERIGSILDDYGLPGLAGLAWELIVGGATDAEILRRIRETPEYAERFGNTNAARRAAGLNPMSEAEIMAWEDQAAGLFRAAGLPAGFYDQPSDFAGWLSGGVSINELSQRVTAAQNLLFEDPPEVREELARLGVGQDAQLAWIIDPQASQPIIDASLANARIGAASRRAGFGFLEGAEMERLRTWGVSESMAVEGFSDLASEQELFQALPGLGESTIGRDTQLEATFGQNADAQETLSRRARARRAQFESGGGYAATSQGVTGLSTA